MDYVWVNKFPLPKSFHVFNLPFGPFYFVKHWFMNEIWWAILQDSKGVRFKVDVGSVVYWFTLCFDIFVYACQCIGLPCPICRSIGWGKPPSPSPFHQLVVVENVERNLSPEAETSNPLYDWPFHEECDRDVAHCKDVDQDVVDEVDIVPDSMSPTH